MAKSPVIQIVVTPEEATRLKAEAKAKGITVSSHARNKLVNKGNPSTPTQP
jgi:hypothetical protein